MCSGYRAELTHTYLRKKSMLFNAVGYIDYSLTIKESLQWLLQMLICIYKSMCRFNQIITLRTTTTAKGDLFNDVILYFSFSYFFPNYSQILLVPRCDWDYPFLWQVSASFQWCYSYNGLGWEGSLKVTLFQTPAMGRNTFLC